MGNPILILGESGTGKSTSIRNLNPKETYLLCCVEKELPFRAWRKNYIEKEGGNFAINDNASAICKLINNISVHRQDIKNLIIDDFQYVMSNEYMRRAKEGGFGKFNDIGLYVFNIINEAVSSRQDLNILFLSHSCKDKDGISKLKTVGNIIDDKVSFEGRFTIILHTFIDITQKDSDKYKFITQNNGFLMAKSPMGMFEDTFIPNDLQCAIEKINDYYKYDEEVIDE